MCHICAILNGIAGIIVFSAPSALSSAWFPPHERTTATGVAIVFNNLGNAMSFFAGPAIVPDPAGRNGTSGGNGSELLGDLFHGPMYAEVGDDFFVNNTCPVIDPDEKAFIEERVTKLMYTGTKPIYLYHSNFKHNRSSFTVFGIVASCVIAIFVYFPSKPKHPPSLTSSMERMDFLPGLKAICTNRNALLMTLCFSMFNGLIASWYSVMNITFEPLPIGNAEDKVSHETF